MKMLLELQTYKTYSRFTLLFCDIVCGLLFGNDILFSNHPRTKCINICFRIRVHYGSHMNFFFVFEKASAIVHPKHLFFVVIKLQ